ncbi:hypothetical protein [Agreia bicolorata]|uniref:hypothetical protein n=1 Tax=Agreia bicolorata TaxID=110935 RepID=UPI001C6FC9B0|nr:hypothetical protein [Agreia bicolorata]
MLSATAKDDAAEILIVSIGKGEHSEGGFYKKAYVYLCVQLTHDGSAEEPWTVNQDECPPKIVKYLAVPREAALVNLGDINYTSPALEQKG